MKNMPEKPDNSWLTVSDWLAEYEKRTGVSVSRSHFVGYILKGKKLVQARRHHAPGLPRRGVWLVEPHFDVVMPSFVPRFERAGKAKFGKLRFATEIEKLVAEKALLDGFIVRAEREKKRTPTRVEKWDACIEQYMARRQEVLARLKELTA